MGAGAGPGRAGPRRREPPAPAGSPAPLRGRPRPPRPPPPARAALSSYHIPQTCCCCLPELTFFDFSYLRGDPRVPSKLLTSRSAFFFPSPRPPSSIGTIFRERESGRDRKTERFKMLGWTVNSARRNPEKCGLSCRNSCLIPPSFVP